MRISHSNTCRIKRVRRRLFYYGAKSKPIPYPVLEKEAYFNTIAKFYRATWSIDGMCLFVTNANQHAKCGDEVMVFDYTRDEKANMYVNAMCDAIHLSGNQGTNDNGDCYGALCEEVIAHEQLHIALWDIGEPLACKMLDDGIGVDGFIQSYLYGKVKFPWFRRINPFVDGIVIP